MRNLFGLVIILLGLGFLLQQLDIPGASQIMRAWFPILIIAAGVIAWNSNRRMAAGPLVIILVGVIMLLDQLNVLNQSAWSLFWPLVLIFIGWRILGGKTWGTVKPETGQGEAMALFSGVDRKVTGPLTDTEVSAWFGGVKLDLREAQVPDNVTLGVFAAFGGIEIWVPKNVKIVTKVLPLFGGAEDKTSPDASATKTLKISGTVLFGGVTIKN